MARHGWRLALIVLVAVCSRPGPAQATTHSEKQYCDHTRLFSCQQPCVDATGTLNIGGITFQGTFSWKVRSNGSFYKLCKPSSNEDHVCCKMTIVCGEAIYYLGVHGCPPAFPVVKAPFTTSTCYFTGNRTWKPPCPQLTPGEDSGPETPPGG